MAHEILGDESGDLIRNHSRPRGVIMPYDAKKPATDVLELVAYLESEHKEGDLYRGQNRDYPALIPSWCREAIISGTENKAVVGLNRKRFNTFLKKDRRHSIRFDLLCELIGALGVAVGNLVAQQYGLSSECLDATEIPSIAAFFASRRYPEYKHIDDGIGVIYRFRRTQDTLLPPDFSMGQLVNWFEMGEVDRVFFDFFVKKEELHYVFDRDRWTESGTHGERVIASTLPLAISWRKVQELISKASNSNVDKSNSKSDRRTRIKQLMHLNWKRSRVARQQGGFIKPRFVWNALVAPDFSLWQRGKSRSGHFGLRLMDTPPTDDPLWPRAVPSCAVKQEIIGVENVRYREGTTPFYFRHGGRRIVGCYRRDLWPEPSEDPVYGEIWHLSLAPLITEYLNSEPEDMPAVDDPQRGLLDRGYRVSGERQTMDARELDDLMRGQLEDAREAVDSGRDTPKDWNRLIAALHASTKETEAMQAAFSALRRYRNSPELMISFAQFLNLRKKWMWSARWIESAALIDPGNPLILSELAELATRKKDYAIAVRHIEECLAIYDPSVHELVEYELVEQAAIIMGLYGNSVRLGELLKRYRELGWDSEGLYQHIKTIRLNEGLEVL